MWVTRGKPARYSALTMRRHAARPFQVVTLLLACAWLLQGCAVVAVADAAVTVVATGVKITAKAGGAVAAAGIPDGDKKQD